MEVIESGDWKANLNSFGTALLKGRGAEDVGENASAIKHYEEALRYLKGESGPLQLALRGKISTLKLASGQL